MVARGGRALTTVVAPIPPVHALIDSRVLHGPISGSHPRIGPTVSPSTRIAFVDGRLVPESEAAVPLWRIGGGIGGSTHVRTRTFRGRPFRIEAHVDALFAALDRQGVDPRLAPHEVLAACGDVLAHNADALARHGDLWITIRVLRSTEPVPGEPPPPPVTIVDCAPLPLGYWSDLHRAGARLVVPAARRPSLASGTAAASLAADTALALADAEVRASDPGAWSVLLDEAGHLCEGLGAHVFVVRAGEIMTPRLAPGRSAIWRDAAIGIARADQYPILETDIRLSQMLSADEVFLAVAGACIVRCVDVNDRPVGRGAGPVTRRLVDAYRLAVDCDFVAQATGAADRAGEPQPAAPSRVRSGR